MTHLDKIKWNRFDICEAWYMFAIYYHGGQYTREYEIFGRLNRMKFKSRPSLKRFTDLTENGLLIYTNLVNKLEDYYNM